MSTTSEFMPYIIYTPGKYLNELKSAKLLSALIAELLGTLFLVLVGCGSCMGHGLRCSQDKNSVDDVVALDVVRIALAFGLVVATLAQSIGHISGCHINPAVTIGLVTGRKMGIAKGALYVVSQCIGALIGAGLLQVSKFLFIIDFNLYQNSLIMSTLNVTVID